MEEIQVEAPRGRPRAFTWRGHRYQVAELLDGWRFKGYWWLDGHPRNCFRARAGGLIAVLYHETPEDGGDGPWWLAQVQD